MTRSDRLFAPARRSDLRSIALAALGAGALALPSCRYLPSFRGPSEPPPPAVSSAATVGADWRLDAVAIGGSPISTAGTGVLAGSSPEFRARVRLLEFADRAVLPQPDLPAWIFAKGAEEPLQPAPRFTAESAAGWLLDRPLPEPTHVRAATEVALGAGAGWSFAALVADRRPTELLLWIDANGELGAALAAEGQVPHLELDEAQETAIAALGQDLVDGGGGREIAPLPTRPGARGVWSLVPTSGTRALALEVVVEPAPTSGPRGLAHAREIAAVRGGVAELHAVPTLDPLLVEARDVPERRRALLVELARGSSRSLPLDLVLLATDDQLARWTARAAETAVLGDRASQAWSLERTALLDTAREMDLGTADPSLVAVMRVHLGALGTEPSLLADVIRRASAAQAFAEALVTETELLLFDPRPAVRVRAYRWLAARGLGPAEFDPLADRATRRAALDAWRRTAGTEAGDAATENGASGENGAANGTPTSTNADAR